MHARKSLWMPLVFCLPLSACFVSDEEAGVGVSRPLPPADEPAAATESTRNDLSAARGFEGVTSPDESPAPASLAEGAGEVMRGDFHCVGDNVPVDPSDDLRAISGRTVYFGTEVIASGTTVTFLDAEGGQLDEVVSDDRGEFAVTVPARVAAVQVWRPGLVRVRYDSTHPALTFDAPLELGAVKPSDVILVEAAAGIHVEDGRGSIVVRTFDCVGDSEVGGVRLAIEGAPAEIYYASSRFELSRELDRTTDSGYAYLFNLLPGTYNIAAWGHVYPGAEGVVLLNRAVVEVGAGELTVLDVHPE